MRPKFNQYELKKIPTASFIMSPIELKDYIDFEIKRVYFMTQFANGKTAGGHCHKVEKEFFIMIQGNCTAVIDRGKGLEEISVSGPISALYMGNFVWHEFKDFSPDAVLLALSSTNYDATRADYVENYEEFQKAIKAL